MAVTLSDRQGFDRRWYAPNLETVYRPSNAEEVAEALRDAVGRYGHKQIQITCGRHCYENFVYRDETRAIIDMTGLRQYGIDKKYGYFIEVGNSNWDMYRTFNNMFDVTLPAGSCYSVGLGGHITGGGYGLLSRLYGLSIDHVTGVDLVGLPGNPTGIVTLHCDAAQDPQLFWALRGGGGGNFGIITRYYFANPPRSPQRMTAWSWSWPWDRHMTFPNFKALLDNYAAVECSQDKNTWNEFSIFKLMHKAAGAITMSTFTYYDRELHGDEKTFMAELEDRATRRKRSYQEIAPLMDAPGPHVGHPVWLPDNRSLRGQGERIERHYTYLEGTQQLNGSGPNQFGKYKSAYMRKQFPEDQALALYEHLQLDVPGMDMSQSLCQVDSYGGKINQYDFDATAIPQRSSIMKLQYQTYWDNDSPIGRPDEAAKIQQAAHLKWINDMYGAVYRSTGGFPVHNDVTDGCYYNYCDNDLGTNNDGQIGRAMDLYFGPNLAKLQDVKNRWNPNDWFHGPQSIPLS